MKVRIGFVSNSSSSSFILVYRPVNFSKITKKDIEAGKKYAFLSEGYEATKLNIISDIESFKFCKKNINKYNELDDIFELGVCIDSDSDESTIDDLYDKYKGFKLMSKTLDTYMADDLDSIKETFDSEEC